MKSLEERNCFAQEFVSLRCALEERNCFARRMKASLESSLEEKRCELEESDCFARNLVRRKSSLDGKQLRLKRIRSDSR